MTTLEVQLQKHGSLKKHFMLELLLHRENRGFLPCTVKWARSMKACQEMRVEQRWQFREAW